MKVSDGIVGPDGTTTVADRGTQVSVLLDLEVAFSFDLGIVRVDPAHPVTTRYKAIGVRSQWGTGTGVSSTSRCRSSIPAAATRSTCPPGR